MHPYRATQPSTPARKEHAAPRVRRAPRSAVVCIAVLGIVCPAHSQFTSGSTGTAGALTFPNAKPGDIVVFDPTTFSSSLNAAGDHVYHFTTITIPKDVTLKLSSSLLNEPVFWLAQGTVQIEGNIDLTGADGTDQMPALPSMAGAGGYAGGIRASAGNPAQPGYGPGAGATVTPNLGGRFTGNAFLVPLVGGSGGSGGKTGQTEGPGCAGGAGGGALLVASSVSITVNGSILADGGDSSRPANNCGGGGSGGAVRLIAPVIAGSGALSAQGGRPRGGNGLIRLEASENQFAGSLNNSPLALGKPFGLFLPPNPPPSVRVVSINGLPPRHNDRAANVPALSINQATPVTLAIEARFLPPGTIIELALFSEDGSRQTVKTTPLQGTLDLSVAEASVVFPTGLSHCYVKASWKQPPLELE
jgi:hypothetical protein